MIKKSYFSYKNTEFKWIGKIPEHWKIKKIKHTTYVKGRIGWQGLKSDEFIEDGPFLVTGTDFQNGKVNWNSCYHISEERYKEAPPIQLKENDLLITKDGSIGKLAIVTNKPEKAILNSGIFVTRPLNTDYYPKFLYWMLSSKVFDDFIRYYETGSTIKHLYQEIFVNFSFPLPRIEEQINISNFLDEICGNTDEIIALKKQQIQTLQKYRQSLITETVTKGLNPSVKMKDSGIEWIGAVPEHWNIKKIKHFANHIGSGKTPKGGAEVYVDEGILFIRSQNVHNDALRLNDVSYITENIDRELSNSRVKKNDILLNITGASIGRSIVYKLDIPANVNQHVCIIRLNGKKISSDFLHYVIINDYAQNQIMAYQNGTSREGLNFVQVANVIFAIPPNVEEQMEIVEFLQNKTDEIDKLKNKITMQIDVLEKYRQSLIYEAVTGKIDVRSYKENELEV